MIKDKPDYDAEHQKPSFEVIEYEGQEARRYPDGAIRNEEGLLLAPHPKAILFDSESAREAVNKRWEKKREDFAEGLVRGVGEKYAGVKGDAEAWSKVGEHAVKVFLETKQARGLAELGRFIGENAGFAPGRTTVNATQNNYNLDTAGLLDAMLRNPALAPMAEMFLERARKRLEGDKE